MHATESVWAGSVRAYWVLLGAALAACALTLITLYAVVLQVGLLVVAIALLTRHPTRPQRAVLLVTVVALVITLVMVPVAAGIAAYNLEGTFEAASRSLMFGN